MKRRTSTLLETTSAAETIAQSVDVLHEPAPACHGDSPSAPSPADPQSVIRLAPAAGSDERRSSLSSLLLSLRQDVFGSVRWLVVNWFAGSRLVPRVVRFPILRLAGVQLETPNVVSGYLIETRSLKVGHGTFVNWGCRFEGSGSIAIGENCHIGPEVMFVTSTHPWMEDGHVQRRADYLPVRIGDRCWLGARSMILPGVTVHDDVVVAAGAVVTGDCEAGGVYAGVPARRIR